MYANVLSLVTVALFARSVVAADCTRSYTVKEGDYCDKISRENKVSTFQLAALNTGKYNQACTDLQVGAVLCLGALPAEDCQTTYTVKLGDTCDAISAAAGTNNTVLYHNNPQIDSKCTNIYVGEVLCTAQSGQAPPIPSTGLTVPVTGPPAVSPPAVSPPANNPPQTSSTAITVPAVGGATPALGAVVSTPTTPTTLPVDNTDDENLPFCEGDDDGY